jgi:lysozyme
MTTVFMPLVMNEFVVEEEEEQMSYTLGIDVSRWQDNNSTAQQMDFTKSVAMGAKFVFIKSSQALWTDEDILYNWKSAKNAGLLRGAYHFLDWIADPRKQAQYAWSIIQSDPGELPPVIDFEYWNPPPPKAYDLLWQYVVEMERLSGRKPIIYTGAFFWDAHGSDAQVWNDYPLWLASYSTQEYMEYNLDRLTPWDKWTFWQWTDKGDGLAFGAESLGLDMNYFNGSLNDLKVFAGIENIPIPVPAPPTNVVLLPELKVISDVRIRTLPNTSTVSATIRMRRVGETVNVLDIKVNAVNSVWARDAEGWSAVVHADYKYME